MKNAVLVRRETIEFAFTAAIQHLAPRARAVLLLRDVLGWSAQATAAALEMSVPAANSSLYRSRTVLRDVLPERRIDWAPANEPTPEERAAARRYVDAVDRGDLTALAELLAADIRITMPPWPMWFEGRDAVMAALRASWDPTSPGYVGQLRALLTGANARPAVALYSRTRDGGPAHPFTIGVLIIADGVITEIAAFHDLRLFPAFGLPSTLG
jgi:RNA polymerase sigma-70 factor (ECF subfamily)